MDEVHLPAGHVLRCALGYELIDGKRKMRYDESAEKAGGTAP